MFGLGIDLGNEGEANSIFLGRFGGLGIRRTRVWKRDGELWRALKLESKG